MQRNARNPISISNLGIRRVCPAVCACFASLKRPYSLVVAHEFLMKNNSRKVLVAAAIAGLLNGAALQHSRAEGTNAPPSTNAAPKKAALGKAAAPKKMPKVQGCAGENDCKGLGGCKTAEHDCKFKNSCKGKGGCEITAKDIKDWQKKHKETPPATPPPAPAPAPAAKP